MGKLLNASDTEEILKAAKRKYSTLNTGEYDVINTWLLIKAVEAERYAKIIIKTKTEAKQNKIPKPKTTFRQNFCICSLGSDKSTIC